MSVCGVQAVFIQDRYSHMLLTSHTTANFPPTLTAPIATELTAIARQNKRTNPKQFTGVVEGMYALYNCCYVLVHEVMVGVIGSREHHPDSLRKSIVSLRRALITICRSAFVTGVMIGKELPRVALVFEEFLYVGCSGPFEVEFEHVTATLISRKPTEVASKQNMLYVEQPGMLWLRKAGHAELWSRRNEMIVPGFTYQEDDPKPSATDRPNAYEFAFSEGSEDEDVEYDAENQSTSATATPGQQSLQVTRKASTLQRRMSLRNTSFFGASPPLGPANIVLPRGGNVTPPPPISSSLMRGDDTQEDNNVIPAAMLITEEIHATVSSETGAVQSVFVQGTVTFQTHPVRHCAYDHVYVRLPDGKAHRMRLEECRVAGGLIVGTYTREMTSSLPLLPVQARLFDTNIVGWDVDPRACVMNLSFLLPCGTIAVDGIRFGELVEDGVKAFQSDGKGLRGVVAQWEAFPLGPIVTEPAQVINVFCDRECVAAASLFGGVQFCVDSSSTITWT
eukprot:PhF_6_TR16939/c0_g1_i1/m.25505